MTELDEKAKEARREYYRQYRKRNPQKIKETNARYWQKRAAKMEQSREAGAHEQAES